MRTRTEAKTGWLFDEMGCENDNAGCENDKTGWLNDKVGCENDEMGAEFFKKMKIN